MDTLLKDLEQFHDLTHTFTPLDIALTLGLGALLSFGLAWVYRTSHRGVSYSQGFVHGLVLLGVVVALVMLVIGSNIARAFALVGALSIVRFRNAVKDSRDVAYIFLVMAVGMAVGTRFYLLAVLSAAVLSALVVGLSRFNLFAKEVRERILRIQVPIGLDHEAVFAEVFRAHLEEQRLISLETVRAGALQEVVYSVVLKRGASPRRLLDDLRVRNEQHKVTLILGQQEIDI
jgi:hypothetical protein